MIHKQGAEYKDDDEIEAAVEADAAAPRKSEVRRYFLIVVVVAVVVIGTIIAIISSTRANKTPNPDPSVEPSSDISVGGEDYWEQFEPDFAYTQEDLATLRAWGYTGDEIELAQTNETPVEDLVAASKRSQEDARATLSNPESPEYLALLNSTWLGQQSMVLPAYTPNVTEGEIQYNTFTYNADYDKISAHGHNLFLKVYLEDGSYTFMECPLLRYMQLPDSGNIVVTYQTATVGGATVVYAMREVTV